MIRLLLVGFGNVGQSFAELLVEKKEVVEREVGEVRVVGIADSKSSIFGDFDLTEAVKLKRSKGRLPSDKRAEELLKELEYDVLVESTVTRMDGGDGRKYIEMALKNGAHVVTSNKGPLATAFNELFAIAEKNGVRIMYEATVGGVVPVIRTLRRYLSICEIRGIKGILNGTCNYILSRMEEERLPYAQILSEAQELGIAEADPSYDVEGIDAAAKLVILANTVGIDAKLGDVERIGITKITPEAFEVAAEKGYTIRLIAEVSEKGMRVTPCLVPLSHPLAVRGTLNVVMIRTDTAGDIFIAGRGAGGRETATAMLSDLVEIYRCGDGG